MLHATAVVLGYAVLAVWLYHPLFADPTRAVFGPAILAVDIKFHIWTMAWSWHALTSDPLSLFDANIFHPFRLSLAGSEHTLGHLPIFGPIYAVSGNPVLAFQLNCLLNLALCGAAMYALLRHWRAPTAAALFGGFVYAFSPIRGVGHPQLIAGQYLPLALLFFDRVLIDTRARYAVGLFVCVALQMLTSYYVAYMTIFAIAGYAAGVAWATRGRIAPRGAVFIAVALAAAGAAIAALSLPYLRVKELGIVPEQEAELIWRGSAGLWQNFLLPPIAVRKWGFRWEQGLSVYLGLLPLGCAAAVLFRQRAPAEGATRWAPAGLLGVAVVSYLMALGPSLRLGSWQVPLPCSLALAVIPGFSSMRVPSRFGLALMAGVAGLAGLGFGRLLCRIHDTRWRRVVGAGSLLALTLGTAAEYDLLRPRIKVHRLRAGADLPPVYRALAEAPPGPVLEIPTAALNPMAGTDYMLYSTYHWQRLLNGYSAYRPPTYFSVMALAALLPDGRATELLARLTGLRYVVVHLSNLPAGRRAAWEAPAGLQLIGSFESDRLFAVADPPPADLLPRFIDFTPSTRTVLGTPLEPLPPRARRGELRLDTPPPSEIFPGLPFPIELTITNRSDVTWPALVSAGTHAVRLAYRWESEDGTVAREVSNAAPLPYDVRPGESVRAVMDVIGFGPPGPRHLVLGLAQDGEWFPDPAGPIPVTITRRRRD